MQDLIKKANVLVEALPYIQKFRNSVMVIKFGGSSMEDPELVRSTMRDVVLLEATGIKPVVVHGGGKAISAELRKQNIPVRFVNGLRFTCDRTIRVVDDVLHNQVNRELVELANAAGGNAVGVSGKQVLKAQRTQSVDPVTGEAQDIGFVGEIVGVNGAKILEEVEAGRIPIVTPLGLGLDGQVYNINADVAACKVAEAIHARKLVFLSDVPGILSDRENEASVIPTICTDSRRHYFRRHAAEDQKLRRGAEFRHQQGAVDRRARDAHAVAGNLYRPGCRHPDRPPGLRDVIWRND